MADVNATRSRRRSRWRSCILLAYRALNLALIERLRERLMNWRLFGFAFRRSRIGKRLVQRRSKLTFLRHRFSYANREELHSIRLGSEVSWILLKLAIDPLVYAAFAVTVLVGIPVLWGKFVAMHGWAALPLPKANADSSLALMATVAPAAAAMLALFFTALSVVASTSYAKVTTNVRSLIANDNLNRRYLRLLAHTATVATAGMGLQVVGVNPSCLFSGYIVVLSTVCFLAFLPLGVRTFALFDPSNLTSYPIRTFFRSLDMMTPRGRHWLDPPFQRHANRIAESQLRMLADLVVFGITDNRPRQDVVLDIATAVARLARWYAAVKPSIPSDSLWFSRRGAFKRWEVADSSMTALALHTGVAPQPDAVPNHEFVEDRCKQMIEQCLRHLLDHGALDDAVNLLLEINTAATVYAEFYGQSEAMRLVATARTAVFDYLKRVDSDEQQLKQFQLMDVLGAAALAPILTTALSLTKHSIDKLVSIDARLIGLDRRALYKEARPLCVLKCAEDLLNRFDFEYSVEGRIETRPSYARDIIASAFAEAIRDIVRSIVATLETEFVSPAKELIDAKRLLVAGIWLHRAIEGSQKAIHQIAELEARYAELKKLHFTNDQWLPLDVDDALRKVEAARSRIVNMLADIVPELCAVPSDERLPDLLGQTRAWLAEEIVAMMDHKLATGFPELFLAYFNANIAIQRHFFELGQQPCKEGYLRVAIDTMIDLMAISGLAFLFTELDETDFARIVTRMWDLHFERLLDKPAMIKDCYTAIDSRILLPIFSPSAMQRQDWGQRLAAALAERGIDPDRHFGPPWARPPAKPHRSAVIESVSVMYGHPIMDPQAYFGALYLSKRAEASGIELPPQVLSCLDSIQLAVRRQRKSINETSEDEPETN
jgi:hypothetical protein